MLHIGQLLAHPEEPEAVAVEAEGRDHLGNAATTAATTTTTTIIISIIIISSTTTTNDNNSTNHITTTTTTTTIINNQLYDYQTMLFSYNITYELLASI